LAISDQQEDNGVDRTIVAGDNNLKGGVIPCHDTPKWEKPGIPMEQDLKQFMKGSVAEKGPLKPAKIPITQEQMFQFLTAVMDLLIQLLTVGRDTPGQEVMTPHSQYEFPGFRLPKKVITDRRTRVTFQQTKE
jgi:hypothetical protein